MTAPLKPRAYDHLVKLLLIGDSMVGKSSILLRFAENVYSSSFITTIGIDYKIKTIELDGKIVRLQVWDSGGQERFAAITSGYYRGAMGVLLVFDLTEYESFDHVYKWLSNIHQYASPHVHTLLLANKCDDVERRQVDPGKLEKLSRDCGVQVFETSAKNNINVAEAFVHITREIVDRLEDIQRPKEEPIPTVDIDNDGNGRSGSCC